MKTFGNMGDLNMLLGGQANERWQDALDRLTRNILDPNTEAKRTRKVTLVITVKPNERRDGGEMSFDIKENLAPPKAVSQAVFFEMGMDGACYATQKLDQIPGQVSMTGDVTPEPVKVQMNKPEVVAEAEDEEDDAPQRVLSFK